MHKRRYTVIPFLLLIVVIFGASQVTIVRAPEGLQVSATSASRDAK